MRDNFNKGLGGLLNSNPIVADAERLLKDPNVPVKQKVQLIATMALPEVKQFKNSQDFQELPLIIMMAVQQVQAQFNSLPENMAKMLLAQQLSRVSLQDLEQKVLTSVETARQIAEDKKLGSGKLTVKEEAGDGLTDEQIDAYLAECFKEAGEEAFVTFALAGRKIVPTATLAFFDALTPAGVSADPVERAREMYAGILETGSFQKATSKYNNAGFNLLSPAVIAKAVSEVAAKVNEDSVYTLAKNIVNKIDASALIELAESGLDFVEDVLKAAKGGNVANVQGSNSGDKFLKALGKQTQLIEDAVIAAGLLPDTDLVAAFKDAQAAKAAEAAPKAVAPKPKKTSGPKPKKN